MVLSNLHSCAINQNSDFSNRNPLIEPLADHESETFLSIDKINVRLNDNDILKSISMDIKRGEFIALLGSSGCGKTTLLRTIAGFNHPIQGSININGKDVTRLAPDKRSMALVFQSYALWPHMSVRQNIEYGLRIRGVAKNERNKQVDEIAALLGLEGLLERKPEALSGGQRQRVALGRALVVEPDILLLDEPLSNLDARIRLTVRHEISALQRRLGITTIHVTHDREEAMVMADRVVILNQGHIAQIGTPEELYNHPISDFVAAFMGAENHLELAVDIKKDNVIVFASQHNNSTVLTQKREHLKSGRVVARFRSEAAQLYQMNNLNDIDASSLCLRGVVSQISYPGGIWRHVVNVGDSSVIVDTSTCFQTGQEVVISVPDNALFLFNK